MIGFTIFGTETGEFKSPFASSNLIMQTNSPNLLASDIVFSIAEVVGTENLLNEQKKLMTVGAVIRLDHRKIGSISRAVNTKS